MFSRQHYITLAQMLKFERNAIDQLPDGVNRELVSQAQHNTVDNIEHALMNILESDNPRFDRGRFLNVSR